MIEPPRAGQPAGRGVAGQYADAATARSPLDQPHLQEPLVPAQLLGLADHPRPRGIDVRLDVAERVGGEVVRPRRFDRVTAAATLPR
ncbi:hypothetical protein OG883_40785 [Streptomyces sp. NBC_01142]|uniref:hypothetical protein n=1 Tax=Streptomyces sp. NBC_01142 TaxID=2975865 RepID=UPI0022565524|nr:hypothetical protein [Streptomyces sp. NBC_01142]MCX4826013.1 hypothetical protein [Streptomyces sp. NBC_01142]